MNISRLSFFVLLPFLSHITAAGEGETSCVHFTYRREWRMMDTDFRRRYIRAVRYMQTSGTYSYFPRIHYELNFRIHGNAVFLPWHRYFVSVFERQVQGQDSTLHVPYWAASYDSQAFEAAPIWGDNDYSFGRSGDGFDNCVRTGPFASWMPDYPSYHCLTRTFGSASRALPAIESVNEAIARISRFDDLAEYLESDVHSYVHVGIGGDMGFMYSPNDPVFFLHHSNIDRLWFNWQNIQPSVRFAEYGGMRSIHYLDFNRVQVTTASSDYQLPGYESIRVMDILHPSSLCYTYLDFLRDENSQDQVTSFTTPRLQPSLEQGSENIQESDLKDNSTSLTPLKAPARASRKLIKLRRVEPLSDDWIKKNFLNITFVRKNENRINRIINTLNRIRGFISPSALWNRPDLFHRLVQGFNVKIFDIHTRNETTGFKVLLRDPKDPTKSLTSIKSKVLKAAKKDLVVPWSLVEPQVLKAIGGKPVLKELQPHP